MIFSITAPAQPHETGVAVHTALLNITVIYFCWLVDSWQFSEARCRKLCYQIRWGYDINNYNGIEDRYIF